MESKAWIAVSWKSHQITTSTDISVRPDQVRSVATQITANESHA